jgi:hypothetical protein
VGELESLINTLVSRITEEFASELGKTASAYFFRKGDETTLLYKKNITGLIEEKYAEELRAVPKNELFRENGTWRVSAPIFLKKDRQRVYWSTPISVEVKLYKYELQKPWFPVSPTWSSSVSTTSPSSVSTTSPSGVSTTSPSGVSNVASTWASLADMFDREFKKTDVGQGETVFEVHWSVNVTATRKFTKPKIEMINFVGTKWDQE